MENEAPFVNITKNGTHNQENIPNARSFTTLPSPP